MSRNKALILYLAGALGQITIGVWYLPVIMFLKHIAFGGIKGLKLR